MTTRLLILSLATALVLAGCAGGDAPGGATTSSAAGTTETTTAATSTRAPQTHTVDFVDYEFKPATLVIGGGDKVVLVSKSSKGHDIKIIKAGSGPSTFEKEQTVPVGQSMEHTFTSAGVYYVYSFHYCTPCQSGTYDAPNTMVMAITVGSMAPTTTTTPAATTQAGQSNTVEFIDYEFQPKTLSVATGTKVTFLSKSSKGHDLKIHKASNGHSTYEREQTVPNGQSMDHTFTSAGTYHVYSFHYCTPCQSGTYDAPNTMTMTITVGSSGAPPATTTATTSTSPTTSGNTVEFIDYEFNPKTLSVQAGTKVTFLSKSSKGHDLKIHKAGNGHSTYEKEQTVPNGQSMDHTFSSTGTYHVYSYHYCTPCQSGTYDAPNTMSMTITVT